jgi:hypothetical protein
MTFLREAPGIRLAETRYGDTLQRIALRELGDASRWVELAELNELRPPYLADPAFVRRGVLPYGASIKLPSPASLVSASADPATVYGADLRLDDGTLEAADGDWVLISGVPNLVQALRHRVKVAKRELGFHPEYGCHVQSLLGASNGPFPGRLAAFYVKSALIEDERVSEVPSCVAEVIGDQIKVTATVVPISGLPVDLVVVV